MCDLRAYERDHWFQTRSVVPPDSRVTHIDSVTRDDHLLFWELIHLPRVKSEGEDRVLTLLFKEIKQSDDLIISKRKRVKRVSSPSPSLYNRLLEIK